MSCQNERQGWLEVGILLAESPETKLKCPSCTIAFLNVWDEDVDDSCFERHIQCPSCGKTESLLINRKNINKG